MAFCPAAGSVPFKDAAYGHGLAQASHLLPD
jgi:hypothetical protein